MRNFRWEDCSENQLYKAKPLSHIVRAKKSQSEMERESKYRAKFKKLAVQIGTEKAEKRIRELIARSMRRKTARLQVSNRRVDSMYSIICGRNNAHIMEYRQDGPKGAGYYCRICDEVELDTNLDEPHLEDQLRRRILR